MKHLSPEDKKARDVLQIQSKQIKYLYISGKIKTYGDLLTTYGYDNSNYYPSELERRVKLPDVTEFLDDRRIALETEQWLKYNPPTNKVEQAAVGVSSEERNNNENNILQTPDNKANIPASTSSSYACSNDLECKSDKGNNTQEKEPWQDFKPAKKQTCTLYWHQKKAAFELLGGFVCKNYRAQLLLANPGEGKTFIIGATIAKLIEDNWFKGKTIAPWPIFYITKASVVEQTKRVLSNFFGLNHPKDIYVCNYDMLRATAGELFVDERIYLDHGVEKCKWVWRPMIHPCMLIADECQAAKNQQSAQSQIMQSYAEIPSDHTYSIWSSATPFTRVAEAKAFVLNLRKSFTSINKTQLL